MIRVLHIGTEGLWRGGENQIRLLVEGLKAEPQIRCYIAYPKGSRGLDRFSQIAPVCELASSKTWDWRNITRLVSFCQNNRVNLIDAHSSSAHSLALGVKKQLPHLGLVVHRRVDTPIKTNRFTKAKYFSPLVDHYVTISSTVDSLVKDFGVSPDLVTLVKSAVDGQVYQKIDRQNVRHEWRQRLGLSDKTVVVGNASALSAQKGYPVMIDAFAKVATKTAWQAVIAGEGKELQALVQQCEQLGISKKVSFIGFIEQVHELLSFFDILCFPSENEGLGTLLLDAAHAGACLVGSRVGGIPEVIIDQKTGLLIEPGDSHGLAAILSKLIDSPQYRQRLNSAAKIHISQEFSITEMVAGNLRVYQQVCQNGSYMNRKNEQKE